MKINNFKFNVILFLLFFSVVSISFSSADSCGDLSKKYQNYIEDQLNRDVANDFIDILKNITYAEKKIVEEFEYNVDDLEINITSEIDFSSINIKDLYNNIFENPSDYIENIKFNEENISNLSYFYNFFTETIFFDIVRDLNVSNVNFNGTWLNVSYNKEDIIEILDASNFYDKIENFEENISFDFDVRFEDFCERNIKINIDFLEDRFFVNMYLESHEFSSTFIFKENSINIDIKNSDYDNLSFKVFFEGNNIFVKLVEEVDYIIDDDNPEIIIDDSVKEDIITINVSANSTNAKINLSSLINLSNGSGEIPSISINASNANNVIVNIPATKIQSTNTSWDGTISTPIVTIVSIPSIEGKTRTQGIAIKVGFEGGSLLFSEAVKLTFPGESGKKVAYLLNDGVFNEISTLCSVNSQNWADSNLAVNGECFFDDGNDIIIWTKHFTEFLTYLETSKPKSSNYDGVCVTTWSCSEWSECVNGQKTRDCNYPNNFCMPNYAKPIEFEECVSPKLVESIQLNNNQEKNDELDKIRAGLGLGAVVGGAAPLIWITIILLSVIILLIILIVHFKNSNKENKEIENSNKEIDNKNKNNKKIDNKNKDNKIKNK